MFQHLKFMPPRQRLGTLLITILPLITVMAVVVPVVALFLFASVTFNDTFSEKLNHGELCYKVALTDSSWLNSADSHGTQVTLRVLATGYCTLRLVGGLVWIWPVSVISLMVGLYILWTEPKRPPTAAPPGRVTG